MTEPNPQLSVDEAMAEFQTITRELLGNDFASTTSAAQTPAEAEAARFRFAEYILGLACPDPRACPDQRCQRHRLCRHFERIHAKQASGRSAHPRRTPGAEATRYAIWVYMNSGR